MAAILHSPTVYLCTHNHRFIVFGAHWWDVRASKKRIWQRFEYNYQREEREQREANGRPLKPISERSELRLIVCPCGNQWPKKRVSLKGKVPIEAIEAALRLSGAKAVADMVGAVMIGTSVSPGFQFSAEQLVKGLDIPLVDRSGWPGAIS